MNLSKTAYSLIVSTLLVIILVYGRQLLIPFVLALLVWFLIRGIRNNGFLKVGFVKNNFPNWLLTVLSSLVIFAVLGVIIQMLIVNIESLSQSLPTYEANVTTVTKTINEKYNIDLSQTVGDFLVDFEFSGILSNVFSSLTEIFGNAFTIVLYAMFILLEEAVFPRKLKAIYTDKEKYNRINGVILKIEKSIGSYLYLKTLISLLTGFLSWAALAIIGVEAPIFWAFLIFLLNYIPTIGSLIATVFPSIFALLQFGEVVPCIIVLSVVGAIQVIVGNIIEPKVMGNSLNISSLVVILALSIWGAIWGITGMILSVPITVIMVIIFAEFKSTRPIALLLSDKGTVSS
jgi:predicted PurR-regulated permease PerM